MQAANRVVKNTVILYIKMGITMFISLYATRLILNALGAEDYGIFSVIGGAIAMLGFLNGAMASATQRFMSFAEGAGDARHQKKVFNVSLVLHFFIAILVGLVLEGAFFIFFNGVLNIPEGRIKAAQAIYHFMVVSTVFTIVSVPYNAIIIAHENMLLFSIVGIVESVLKLVVAFVVVYTLQDKLIIYGLLMACIAIFSLMVYRIYCHNKYVECVVAPLKYFDKKLMKEMTGFAGWNFLGSASGMIAGYGSGIILNHFHGTRANAANGVAGQLNGQLLVFSNTMQKALNPIIDKSEGGGKREFMIKATLSGSKFSFLIFAFFSIPFLIEAPFILKIWLKNVPEWAIIFTRLGIIYTLIDQTTRTLGTAIMAVGNIKAPNIYHSLIILLNLLVLFIVFNLGFAPYYMPALAVVVAIILAFTKLYYANKYCGISYWLFLSAVFFRILGVFLIALFCGLIPFYLMDASIYRLAFVILATSSSFLLASYLFAFSSSENRIMIGIKDLIIKKVKNIIK